MSIAALLAVCLLQVNEGNAKNQIQDWVCSEENLPVRPETCGQLKDLFDLKEIFTPDEWRLLITPQTESRFLEFYRTCCSEA